MDYNPALDLPLTEIPHTLVMSAGGRLFYFEFPSEPGPEEFQAAVVAVGNRVAKDTGQVPSSANTIYRRTSEIRWPEILRTLDHDPVKVI